MPLYPFECPDGHVTEKVYGMNEEKPKAVKCGSCRRKAKRVYTSAPSVVPDFPEHYNVSMGCVVKNRAHHKQIQKERGLQDYEPVKNSAASNLTFDRLRANGRKYF